MEIRRVVNWRQGAGGGVGNHPYLFQNGAEGFVMDAWGLKSVAVV